MSIMKYLVAIDENRQLIDAQFDRFNQHAKASDVNPETTTDLSACGFLESVVTRDLDQVQTDLRQLDKVKIEFVPCPENIFMELAIQHDSPEKT